MARKTLDVRIDQEGRDKGKRFFIEEWAAFRAERWAWRVFLALANSGIDIGDTSAASGMAGLAVLGFGALARMKYEDAQPLLDEMLSCVQICPDPNNASTRRDLVEEDIDEVRTILKLRAEVFTLHTGFSIPVFQSRTNSGTETAEASPSQNTPMSRPRAAPRSLPARPA